MPFGHRALKSLWRGAFFPLIRVYIDINKDKMKGYDLIEYKKLPLLRQRDI
jgi:hypothetical protein